jgi:hypothetical protein
MVDPSSSSGWMISLLCFPLLWLDHAFEDREHLFQ